jgi:hypothetical protein
MADTEFDEPERIELLKTLTTALGFAVIAAPTVWACLWLSDISQLRELVHDIQTLPAFRRAFPGWVRDMEITIKLIPKCGLHT